MTRIVSIGVLLVLAAVALLGQAAVTPPEPKEVLMFVGMDWNRSAAPQVSGGLGALYPLSPTTGIGAAADFTLKKTGNPLSSIRIEGVKQLGEINRIPIYGILDGGPAFAASDPAAAVQQAGNASTVVLSNLGTNVGYLAMSGLGASIPIGRGLYLLPSARALKGSLTDAGWVIGIKIGYKAQIAQTP